MPSLRRMSGREAIRQLTEALALDPGNKAARTNLELARNAL